MTPRDHSEAVGSVLGPDGTLSFHERQLPLEPLGAHDLRVKVHAISINPVDTKLSRSREGFQVLGFDGVGVVVATGPHATRFTHGDTVWYAGTVLRTGTMQSLHTVDERLVGRAPARMSPVDAAALPLTAITAWEVLFEKLRLTPESTGTLIVVGAAGGVGSVLIQLVRTLLPGVRVVGTASRPESARWASRIGAHDVIDHSGDLSATAHAAVPGGADWIVSTASRGRIEQYSKIIAPFGQIVGIDRGPIEVTPLKALSATWHWEYMFTRADPERFGDAHHRVLETIVDLVDDGRIVTTRHGAPVRLSAATLRDAYQTSEAGRTIGKVVLSVS